MKTTPAHHLSAAPGANTQSSSDDLGTDRLALTSAFFDGEFDQSLSTSPTEAGIDPLAHKQDWAIYALIADTLTQPSGRAFSPSAAFTARLSAALEREPVYQLGSDAQGAGASKQKPARQTGAKTSTWSRWVSWPSLSVAAAVTAVVWVAQPLLTLDESVVVATPVMETQPTVAGAVIADYANAHRQFSGPIAVRQASFEPEAEK